MRNNHLTTESSINGLKTKIESDLTKYVQNGDYDTKVGNLALKIPDISGLLPTNTFNSKVGELENKIKIAESKPDISNLGNKTELKNVENKIPNTDSFVKKTEYETTMNEIKNDYVSIAALDSRLNELKSQQIADEVKKADDKVTKNSSDILGFESRLKQKEDLTTELEREASFNRGNYYYNQQSYFLFEPKSKSYDRNGGVINSWISTGIHNDSNNTDLFSVKNSGGVSPKLINQNNRLGVLFEGSYMKQNMFDYGHGSGLNIYIVYKLNKIDSTRNAGFTIQNALFGAIKITKDVN